MYIGNKIDKNLEIMRYYSYYEFHNDYYINNKHKFSTISNKHYIILEEGYKSNEFLREIIYDIK